MPTMTLNHALAAGCWLVLSAGIAARPVVGAAALPEGAGSADALQAGFESPPASARPRVWWHWLNGNVTAEGVRLDIEWMHRVGIGGLQNFDGSLRTPQRVAERVVYMTPEWKRAFRVAAETADKYDLELSVAGSPGWSESGGPWIKPAQAMKKLVWSEAQVSGGRKLTVRLAPAPTVSGPFQNVPGEEGDAAHPAAQFGADVATIAYRVPRVERSMMQLHPRASNTVGVVGGAPLWDGDLAKAVRVPFGAGGQPGWLQYDFVTPQTVRALTIGWTALADVQPAGELQSSLDGVHFTRVCEVPMTYFSQSTLSFAPVRARYFRLLLPTPKLPSAEEFASAHETMPTAHELTEYVLHTGARVHQAESKAGFTIAEQPDAAAGPEADPVSVVRKEAIVDLSDKVDAQGNLRWEAPAGRWVIMRFGYSLTGALNGPASPEATGLEVDKLSAEHVRANYREYLGRFAEFLGPGLTGAHGLRGVVNDSWEAGVQNWSERLPEEFKTRRGYDLRPWLPALAGRVVQSSAATERFLWDFRQTLGDLVAENHYQVIAGELHDRGMVHYAESHESARAYIGDGMDVKRFSDVPMGAMWMPGTFVQPIPETVWASDIRESASVAHLYGQNLVAAESMTAEGMPALRNSHAYMPEDLKPTADREFVSGVNRIVVHTSDHQPLETPGPGFTLGPFGQWFTRKETWAEQATPWVSYLARTSYMLQQGRFVADVLYFYGEDSNITALYREALPPVPEGYNFDFASAQALQLLAVDNGQLVTRSGMRYRLLVLDPRTRTMSLPVLQRLRELVLAGATVLGARPASTPSLADDPQQFASIAAQMWGEEASGTGRTVGKGRVISGGVSAATLQEALNGIGAPADFSYRKPQADSQLDFLHRHLADGEAYFVVNRQPRAEQVEVSFRVTGKAPQLWHADSGAIEPAAYRMVEGRTVVTLDLEKNDALFVVFREPTDRPERRVTAKRRAELTHFTGPWELHFPAGQPVPAQVSMPALASWTASADPGVKYFSGTARYTHDFDVPAGWLQQGRQLELDLGAVKNIAEVRINGQPLATLWKAPYRVDVTASLHAGSNRLEVAVTNPWVNRLIGDKQPGVTPYAYSTHDPYLADSPLLESGLLGPVRLQSVEVQ